MQTVIQVDGYRGTGWAGSIIHLVKAGIRRFSQTGKMGRPLSFLDRFMLQITYAESGCPDLIRFTDGAVTGRNRQ